MDGVGLQYCQKIIHAREVGQEVVAPQERARHQCRIFVVLIPTGTLKRTKSKISTVPQEAKKKLPQASRRPKKLFVSVHLEDICGVRHLFIRIYISSVALNFTSSR